MWRKKNPLHFVQKPYPVADFRKAYPSNTICKHNFIGSLVNLPDFFPRPFLLCTIIPKTDWFQAFTQTSTLFALFACEHFSWFECQSSIALHAFTYGRVATTQYLKCMRILSRMSWRIWSTYIRYFSAWLSLHRIELVFGSLRFGGVFLGLVIWSSKNKFVPWVISFQEASKLCLLQGFRKPQPDHRIGWKTFTALSIKWPNVALTIFDYSSSTEHWLESS